MFHTSTELIFARVPLLHEIPLLCPRFLDSMYSTFLLRPAMSREIQRCDPLLSWQGGHVCRCAYYLPFIRPNFPCQVYKKWGTISRERFVGILHRM